MSAAPQALCEARCCCCGNVVVKRDPDPWEGRMDDYCESCSWNRCDTSDSTCEVKLARSQEIAVGDLIDLWQFLRRLAARWIATPWWNLRFSLGMWIGGFTHTRRDYE